MARDYSAEHRRRRELDEAHTQRAYDWIGAVREHGLEAANEMFPETASEKRRRIFNDRREQGRRERPE